MEPLGTEIRVHGIGEHGEFSSLGSHLEPVGEGAVERSEVPERRHRLQLLNWSRFTWKKFRFTWFLALPYSLVNLSGYMALPAAPQASGLGAFVATLRRLVSTALPHVFGIVITMCSVPWIAACLESFLRHWRAPQGLDRVTWWAAWPVVAAGLALAGPMVFRAFRRGLESAAPGATALHVGVVVATCWLLLSGNWIRRVEDLDGRTLFGLDVGSWIAACTPGDPGLLETPPICESLAGVPHAMASIDPLALIVGTGFLVLVAFTVLAMALNLLPHAVRGHRVALSGALAAGWAGFALLNAVFGLIALGLSWLSIYAQFLFPGFRRLHNIAIVDCTSIDASQGMSACVRTVYAYEPRGGRPWFHMTFVPSLVSVVVLVVLLLVFVAKPEPVSSNLGVKVRVVRRAHATVRGLGAGAPWTVLIIVLVAAIATVMSWTRIMDDQFSTWDGVATLVAHAGALVGVLRLVTLGRVPKLKALGYVGDLVGFWPVRHHPLAGSSYRDSVVRDLHVALDKAQKLGGPVVLVGHSQGSVLAAWVTNQRGTASRHALITCGSPLAGLYGTFFPRDFSSTWFEDTRRHAGSWVNFWRDTDPISAPIAALGDNGNQQLVDDRKPVNSHSNYWEDERQSAAVLTALGEQR